MSMDSGDANQLQRALAQSIHEHWVLFLIEGRVAVSQVESSRAWGAPLNGAMGTPLIPFTSRH